MTAKKPMTAAEFKKLAELAFGKRWKMVVLDKLGTSREMLWRYEKGETPISEELADKFRRLFQPQIIKQAKVYNDTVATF